LVIDDVVISIIPKGTSHGSFSIYTIIWTQLIASRNLET